MTPDKETVRAAYIAEIGYDCFADSDDDVTVEEAWAIVRDCRAYRDAEHDAYPGWTSMQAAMRDNW